VNNLFGRAIGGMNGMIGPRGRIIAQTGAWSVVARACSAANALVSIPFVLHALGPVQFGAWATLASLIGLAGFLDFGFGNGTMNLVAGARGRGATNEIRTIVSEGMRALWRIAAYITPIAAVALFVIPWYLLLGLPESEAANCRKAAAVVLGTIVCGIPLSLASRVQLGLNRGDRTFRWQAFGQLVTLLVVVACARAGGSLALLTCAAITTPLIATFANTLDLYRSQQGVAASRDRAIARQIRHEGALFFVLQTAAALAYSSDLALISALRGPADAGTYAIVQRLFSLITVGLSLLWMPLWPIYRQALAANDSAWIMRTLRSTLSIAALAAAIAGLILALGFDHIVRLWVHRPIVVSGWLLAGFAVWYVVEAVGNGIGAFLNAASIVWFQVITASCFALLCFAGKAWTISIFGMESAPWTTTCVHCLVILLPTFIFGRRLVAQALSKNY
jgi:O-antigen/teichoic acid export membrane protein